MRTAIQEAGDPGSASRLARRRYFFLVVLMIAAFAMALGRFESANGRAVAQTSETSASAAPGVAIKTEPMTTPLTKDQMTFLQRVARSFEKTFITDTRWKLFLDGLGYTVLITLLSALLGTALAVVQCVMRRSKRAWLRYPAKVYIAVMQGTPILVVLLIMYYMVFTKLDLPGWFVASIALALNFAAYAGEQMRVGVDGIDKGLIEAARALGFDSFGVFRKIILPIATRSILPVYKGEFISLLKTTSIVGYVAIQDLTKASDIVRGRTYECFFPLISTAIIYLLTAHFLSLVFTYIEWYLNPISRRKRATKKEEATL